MPRRFPLATLKVFKIGLLAAAALAAIVFAAAFHLRRPAARQLYDRGTRTQATVIEREDGSQRIAYDYVSDDDKLHTVGLREVPRSCYKKAEPEAQLGLVYDPKAPEVHRLLCEQDLAQTPWPSIVLGGTGVVLLVYAARLWLARDAA